MKVPVFLFILASLIHAATPTMWVKNRDGRVPLRIETINAEVRLIGDIAETTLTLQFRNETNRRQEGEFVMPLPEGSTVSSYALEVNGALRDGVSVEKKQARNAYETIKRQKIDPGLVEREAHNTYRTKVFPIMPKSTKLVRISYIERLHTHAGKLRYRLPIDYPGAINKFTCNIQHEPNTTPKVHAKELTFSDSENNLISAIANNKKLSGHIEITLEQKDQIQFLVENASASPENHYFYVSYPPPNDAAEKPRRAPQNINIIWDASDSRRSRDHKKELHLLDAYFKSLASQSEITVSLQLLRNTLQNAGEFKIKQGNWKSLRQRLDNVFYDGSSAYNRIKSAQHKSAITLFFTDADRQEDGNTLQINSDQTTFIIHHGASTWFYRHTKKSHGASINLTATPLNDALHQLTHTHYQINHITSDTTSILSTVSEKNDKTILVGTYHQRLKRPIEVFYQNGNGEQLRKRIPINTPTLTTSSHLIQRLWAQEKLIQLERNDNASAPIIKHCQQYGLVSDYTSLIVLERFQDYVRFNIPPPEPELKKKWATARKQRQSSARTADSLTTRIRQAWQRRLSWYQKTYSWRSKAMFSHRTQADIWLRAVQSVFNKNDLDQKAYGVIESWYKQTGKNQEIELNLNNQQAYDKWLKQQDRLIKQWIGFRQLPVKQLENQPLAISIRGLVSNPDTYRTDQTLTLRQSIDLAGGLHPDGSLQYVSLYRNAHAMTYNLLSRQFKDILLLPGDMVVAEAEYSFDSGDWDSFGSSSDPTDNPADEPAEVSRPVPRFSARSGDGGSDDPFGDPFGGSFRSGNTRQSGKKTPNTEANIRIISEEIESIHLEELKQLEQQLQQKKDPHTCYQSIKGNHARSAEFYLAAARILNQHQHRQLAIQAISNISEYKPRTSASLREAAYLLGSLNLWKEAIVILENIKKQNPHDTLTQLDILRYSWSMNPTFSLSQLYQDLIIQNKSPSSNLDPDHITYALTERNASLKKEATTPKWRHLNNLAVDLRCVIYASDPEVRISPEMKEPIDDTAQRSHTSSQGGQFFTSPGIDEYMLKRAIPGTYTLACRSERQVTLQIAFYSHWGTDEQTCQSTTVTLEPSRAARPIAEYTLKFKE